MIFSAKELRMKTIKLQEKMKNKQPKQFKHQ